jgi:16S rRNA processing protein RimM
MSLEKDFLRLVGIIIKPHGLKGEVLVKPLTDYPKSFFSGEILFLDDEGKETLHIEKKKNIKVKGRDGLLIKFAGIDDVDSARLLSQRELFRMASSSPELEKDVFWVDDIIGCNVYCPDYVLIGKVENVLKGNANDNLVVICQEVVEGSSEKKEFQLLVPLVEDYIFEIDISQKKIKLKMVPDYL